MRISRLALVLLLALGCSRSATVEGDLSVDGTKGAYKPISLVRNGDSLLAAIDALCEAERADIQQRSERIRTLQATAERFRRMPARTSIAQVMLGDSVDKYRQAYTAEQRAESERPDTVAQKIGVLVSQATDSQTVTDKDGHFRFPKRQPGVYLLYVDWRFPSGDKEFLARVDATSRGTKTQNLDASTVTKRLRCR